MTIHELKKKLDDFDENLNIDFKVFSPRNSARSAVGIRNILEVASGCREAGEVMEITKKLDIYLETY